MSLTGNVIWSLMERVIATCGPLLLLLRLADSNSATLSKLKITVDNIMTLMSDTGDYDSDDDSDDDNDTRTLEQKICSSFQKRLPELESDVASAAYVLDPQFVQKSKLAGPDVMNAFWSVSRNVLRVTDDGEWRTMRQKISDEITRFRMKTGAFALEDYTTSNACSFWGVAGNTLILVSVTIVLTLTHHHYYRL